MRRVVMLGAIVALMLGGIAHGDEKAKGTTHAVVVGVGSFADKEIKPRPTADSDARAVAAVLRDKSIGGVAEGNLALLLSKAEDKAKQGTKANILEAIGEAVKKAGKDDTLLIYFVMQGATAGEKACVFTTDSTFKDRTKDALFATEIEEKMKGLKAEHVFAFYDFNLKAYESKEAILAPDVSDFLRVALGLKEKDPDQEVPTGRVVFLSGSAIQPPVAVDGQGVFTKSFLEAVGGKADVEGYEADGVVTVDEARKHMEKVLPDLGKAAAKTNEEKEQRLFFRGRVNHHPLTRSPAAATTAEARLKKFGERATALSKEVIEEGTALLSQMPRLKALQELRKSYQKFADGDLSGEQLAAARERIKTSMQINADDAKAYADKVFEGLTFVRSYYIKKLNLGEMVGNGIKGLYRVADNAPLSDDLKARLEKAKELSDKEIKELLRDARMPLGRREDLDKNKDVELSMNFALRKFVDDYTMYVDQEKVAEMDKDIDGRFTGIGVQIRQDVARDGLLVVTPIRNSPAYRAGLLAGDLITEIIRESDNKGKPLPTPEVTSTKGMLVSDAVKLILGLPSTKLKLKVEREGEAAPKIIELTRDVIEVESVYGYKRNEKDDSWNYYIDPKNKIAYLYLTQFARNSATDMAKAIKQLQKEGVKGVVLDLRFNPGGFLDVAIDICDMFIDDGVIVSVRPGNTRDRERTFKGRSAGSFLDFPMVCLVNDGSASGSEILSACLQDHGRAVVMGERSFGKGSVQNVEKFPLTGGKIKLTTATFWPPSGRNLNKASTSGKEEEDWGVKPESQYTLKLERSEKEELFQRIYNWGVIPRRDIAPKEKPKEFKDRQLEMALEYLRSQIKLSRGDAPGKDG